MSKEDQDDDGEFYMEFYSRDGVEENGELICWERLNNLKRKATGAAEFLSNLSNW